MEVVAHYSQGLKFEVEARGHKLTTDQPVDDGGWDDGFTPPELFLASIGTCVGHYVIQYLKSRQLPADGVEVRVAAGKLSSPTRLGPFQVAIFTEELPERHREGVLRAARSCLIHNTLHDCADFTFVTHERLQAA